MKYFVFALAPSITPCIWFRSTTLPGYPVETTCLPLLASIACICPAGGEIRLVQSPHELFSSDRVLVGHTLYFNALA